MSSAPTATKKRFKWPSFSVQVIIGLILGVLLGWLALTIGPAADGSDNWLVVTLSTIGSSFVTLLRAVVPPLVFTAIVASIANLRGIANGARLAAKTLIWFAITALISVVIGIALGLIMKPGLNTTVSADAVADPSRTGSWLDFLNGLIPSNFLGLEVFTRLATDEGGLVTGASSNVGFNVLQILIIAIVVGIAALRVGAKAQPFLDFTASALVDHPVGADRHRGSDRKCDRLLRLVIRWFAGHLRPRHLHRIGPGFTCRLPGDPSFQPSVGSQLFPRCVASDPAWLRLAIFHRYAAPYGGPHPT